MGLFILRWEDVNMRILLSGFVKLAYIFLIICSKLQEKIDERETPTVEFIQKNREKTLVYWNEVPADRDGWLYLPFMVNYSKRFQPPCKDGGYLFKKKIQNGKLIVKKFEKVVGEIALDKGKVVYHGDPEIRNIVKVKI